MKKITVIFISLMLMCLLACSASAKLTIGDSIKGEDDLQVNLDIDVNTETQQPQPEEPQEPEVSEEPKTLGKVTGLSFVKSTENSIQLSWDKVEDAYAYKVFIKGENDKKFKYSYTTRSTKVTIDNISDNGSMKFKVRAFCYHKGEAVFGKFSSAVSAVTAPAGVRNIYTRSITDDSVTLYWNAPKGATGYRVYIYDKEKKAFKIYKRTSRTTLTVSGLKKNTDYTFKIRSYKKIDTSTAFGKDSDKYKERTYNAGSVPKTTAQAAQYYNNHIAKVKSQKDMKVKYYKSIETGLLLCSKTNLANTVRNTLNLFDGVLDKTYNFKDGMSDKKSVNKLFEPYGKKASLVKDDIKDFEVTKNEKTGSYTLKITLKSEERRHEKDKDKAPSYYDGVISLPEFTTLNTAPLVVDNSLAYYDGGTLALTVKDGKAAKLVIHASVLANVHFTVADVKADSTIGYELKEQYKVTY